MNRATDGVLVNAGEPSQMPLLAVDEERTGEAEDAHIGRKTPSRSGISEPEEWRVALITESAAMDEVPRQIESAAQADVSVLIYGDIGTGKELVARLIHERSARRGRPFVSVNCSSMSGSRMARELLGHEREGASASVREAPGKMEEARGGTVFLAEVGDLDAHLQREVLRALQEGQVRKVGSEGTVTVDIRIVASSSFDLEPAVGNGYFRRDLHALLKRVTVRLPPLRERKGDVDLLATFFVDRYSALSGRKPPVVSTELREILNAYPWPGNVEELEKVIRRLLMRIHGPVLTPEFLPARFSPWAGGSMARRVSLDSLIERKLTEFVSAMHEADAGNIYRIVMESVERPLLQSVLRMTRGNQVRAAALLGINRNTLRKKIQTLKIERPG